MAPAQRTAWLLFAPPAALVGWRWVLQWQADRGPQTPVLPLTPFTALEGPMPVLLPLLWGLAALLVLALCTWGAGRRWGWGRVRPVLALAWIALCLVGGGALLHGFLNVHGLQALAPVQAQVLGSRVRPPSLRGPGGTQLVLRVAGQAQPQQVLIDDPQAAQWLPGQRITLQWARGRSSGLFVTGWQALAGAEPGAAEPRPLR